MIVWNFWVMWCLLFQPWAVLAVCDRSDRSEGTGLTGPSACWSVCGSGIALLFACVRYMTYCITNLFMMITHTCYTPRMLRFRGSLICAAEILESWRALCWRVSLFKIRRWLVNQGGFHSYAIQRFKVTSSKRVCSKERRCWCPHGIDRRKVGMIILWRSSSNRGNCIFHLCTWV